MVEVTQADRELLIELISFDSETIDAILAGNAFTWEVEQIARHRIASLEEAAKVAIEALTEAREALHFHYVEWDGEPEDAVPLQLTRSRCDAAIRALEGPSNA